MRTLRKAINIFFLYGFSGLWKYGILFFKDRSWYIYSYLHRRFGGAIIARNATDSFTLWPKSTRRVYFRNLKKGVYHIELRHGDRWVGSHGKSLIALFRFFSGAVPANMAQQIGLTVGDEGRPFVYLGEGKFLNNAVTHIRKIELPKDERWLCIDLCTPYDRLFNIDGLSLCAVRSDLVHVRSAISSLLKNNAELHETEFLLYADIDLDVVDGSSIWLSSMTSILCGVGKCILVAKSTPRSNIVLSNIQNQENLTVIGPTELGLALDQLSVEEACEVLRCLDAALPNVRNVVVRGLDASARLHETRQFRKRSFVYLTDFYYVKDGEAVFPRCLVDQSALCVTHAGAIFVQTPQIDHQLRAITQVQFKAIEIPPVIPDKLPEIPKKAVPKDTIRIGYAGKINPDWGIEELLDWIGEFATDGRKVELHIVANKISDGSGRSRRDGFREDILNKIKRSGAIHYTDLNRHQAMKLMAEMDFVWCWRPARLEDGTLELSTKLIEMAACGAKCICYPNEINKSALGADYPFFARDRNDLRKIIGDEASPPSGLADKLRKKHGLSKITEQVKTSVLTPSVVAHPRRICVAGHDYKFIDAYLSHLKSIGHKVVRDPWEWGEAKDIENSAHLRDWAEIVLCEWGLANAVWHSHNATPGKRVFIRAHLQEVNKNAKKFGYQIKIENVEKVIFVSANVRDRALELFDWPIEKTVVIPNFVLDDEYQLVNRELDDIIKIGMVGITPQRKRFDRAIDTLLELRRRGHNAQLHIKGPRPETLEFMHAPARKAELEYYAEIYERIDRDPLLAGNVQFYPWGNDVALWYRNVDHILSCSEFESFHYALADGVLTGCQPLIWRWDGADVLYSKDWMVADSRDAADRIETFRTMSDKDRTYQLTANRSLIVERYGHEKIFQMLNETLGI